MYWSLKVSDCGKIKSAEIEVAPLTLFVGDNNSGKSYLMSLVWGIQNFGMIGLLREGIGQEGEEENVLMGWLRKQVAAAWERGVHVARVNEVADVLQSVLNRNLKLSKNNLISTVFNSENVKIGEMQIELKGLEKISLISKREV